MGGARLRVRVELVPPEQGAPGLPYKHKGRLLGLPRLSKSRVKWSYFRGGKNRALYYGLALASQGMNTHKAG